MAPALPQPQATQLAYTLKVASLNIWAPGPPGRQEPLAALMRQADVVLLQELRSTEELMDLARRAQMPYFQGAEDVGIASRLPFTGFTSYRARRTPSLTPLNQLFRFWYTPLCSVQLWHGGRRHHVFSNHWDNRQQRNRLTAVEAALRALAQVPEGEPVIFGGDLNCHMDSRELQALVGATSLVDSFPQLREATHCGGEPNRIDFILTRGLSPTLYEARCLEEPVPTDHPLVFVELQGQEATAVAAGPS